MPSSEKSILFTSNCFGEDRMAAVIARELRKLLSSGNNTPSVLGASLISEGKDYSSRGIELLFASKVPPSGGFPTKSLKGFFDDLRDGGIGNAFRFMKTLKHNRSTIRLAVAVGDVTLLLLTRWGLGKKVPILFFATAKSDAIEPHYAIERAIIRRISPVMIARDELTAQNLSRKKIEALFLGNPMLDDLEAEEGKLHPDPSKPTIGILPGSRDEAYQNLLMALEVLPEIEQEIRCNYYVALPGTLQDEAVIEMASHEGWVFRPQEDSSFFTLNRQGCHVVFTRGIFGTVLHASDVVIGLAGTANEQAAGLGKPVVTFTGSGPQTTPTRMREQEKLLLGAAKYVEGPVEMVAEEVISLLKDTEERGKRGEAGIRAMGLPGAGKTIAEWIAKRFPG